MGYETRFSLKMSGLEVENEETEILNENVKSYGCYLEECLEDYHKWYDYKDDMKIISLKYPYVLFELSGEGEESGDVWKCYFKNGKYQHCKGEITIEYDPYDETKLI